MANHVQQSPTGWVGWIVFAGILLIMDGIFQAIIALTTLFDSKWYAVTSSHGVLVFNYTAWGWIQLLLGIALILVGSSLFSGNMVGRVVAVILVGLSAIANLTFIAAYPFWSLIVLTVDVLVLYAIIVHGDEMRET
jgi:hypothetical protein